MSRNVVYYLIPVVIWGSTWTAIRFQLGVVDPLVSIGYRFMIAATVLFGYCLIRKINLRFRKTDHLFFIMQGVLLFGINYWLVYEAEKTLTSGIVALIFPTLIFMNILNGALWLNEPIRKPVLLGGFIGIAGVGLVFWDELRSFSVSGGSLTALLLVLLSVCFASLGNITSARNQKRNLPVLQTNGFGMLYGGLAMLAAAVVTGKPFVMDLTFAYIGSLLYLSLFGSIIAFWAYLTLLGRIGADRVAYTALIVPIIALTFSTVLEDYTWTFPSLAGVVVILLGNLLILKKQRARPEDDNHTEDPERDPGLEGRMAA